MLLRAWRRDEPKWSRKVSSAERNNCDVAAAPQGIWGIIYLISTAALCGRRVEVDIKSRDLAVPCDDEIHTGVLGRFAFRPRTPSQASRIVQNLGRSMRSINEMRMRRSEIASELVQCVMTDERA